MMLNCFAVTDERLLRYIKIHNRFSSPRFVRSISTRDNRAAMDELERSDRERSKLVE